jgi:hypothetical protein
MYYWSLPITLEQKLVNDMGSANGVGFNKDSKDTPKEIMLYNNDPDPFSTTTYKFDIPASLIIPYQFQFLTRWERKFQDI